MSGKRFKTASEITKELNETRPPDAQLTEQQVIALLEKFEVPKIEMQK